MSQKGCIFRITEAGRRAWENQDPTVPSPYRRILGVVDPEAHYDVIRGFLRRYPDHLIQAWVGELQELRLLEPASPSVQPELDFAARLRLPALVAEDEQRLALDAKQAIAALASQGAYLAAERLKNRPGAAKPAAQTTILIVEDDPDQLTLARLRVGMAGYSARTADSAAALRAALRDEPSPDLLLLDIELPDGDGFDILAALRRHPEHALLPVVMLTVKDSSADVRKGLALGADGYVTKPYSKTVLADTIRQVLGTPSPSP
jgi:CheY-like chemotaxis protein